MSFLEESNDIQVPSIQVDARIYEKVAARDKAWQEYLAFEIPDTNASTRLRKARTIKLRLENIWKGAERELMAFVEVTYPKYFVEGNVQATIANILQNIEQPAAQQPSWVVNPSR